MARSSYYSNYGLLMHATKTAAIGGTICGLLAVFGVGIVTQFWCVLPVADQWGMVEFYRTKVEHGLTFADWIAPQNEHRLALIRLAFLLDYDWFQGRSIFVNLIAVLSNLVLGSMIGALATAGLAAAQRAFGIVLSIAFFVSPVQIENIVLPIHMSYPLVCVLAIVAFASTARAGTEQSQSLTWIYLSLGSVATLLCPFTMANGIIASVIAAGLAWVLPAQASVRISITVAAFAAVATCLWGLQLPNESLHATLVSAHGIRDAINFFLAFIGLAGAFGPRALGGIDVAIFVGIAGIAVWTAMLLRSLERWRRSCSADPNTIALFLAATFIVVTGIMITLGRAGAGPAEALSTRYATFSLAFWASLIGTAWRMAPELGPLAGLARRSAGVATIVMLLLSYVAWFRVAQPSYARTAAADVVSAELRMGRFDPTHVLLIYPRPDEIRDEVDFLRRRRLSIFAQ
jgi:hypothetical protein